MTMTAFDMGWNTFEPVTLPAWDLLQVTGREQARKYLQQTDPDLIMIAVPCTAFSRLQTWNQKNPYQCRELQRKRREGRELAKFTEEVVNWQTARLSAVLVENP